MGRPIHFEIHCADLERAKKFYGDAFGWSFVDYQMLTGTPYFGVITGPDGEPGINGGMLLRPEPGGGPGAPVNGAVLTFASEDYDADHDKIIAAGGTVALPRLALAGLAWQGYYLDTEGNVFGIHQPDPNAA